MIIIFFLIQKEDISAVTSELCSLSAKRSYIRPLCTQCLLDLAANIDSDAFSNGMWCHLKGELSKGWEDCTVDRLLLLLAFRKREQVSVPAYLRVRGGRK